LLMCPWARYLTPAACVYEDQNVLTFLSLRDSWFLRYFSVNKPYRHMAFLQWGLSLNKQHASLISGIYLML